MVTQEDLWEVFWQQARICTSVLVLGGLLASFPGSGLLGGGFFSVLESCFMGTSTRVVKFSVDFYATRFLLPMFHYYDQTTDEEGWGSFPGGRIKFKKKKSSNMQLELDKQFGREREMSKDSRQREKWPV